MSKSRACNCVEDTTRRRRGKGDGCLSRTLLYLRSSERARSSSRALPHAAQRHMPGPGRRAAHRLPPPAASSSPRPGPTHGHDSLGPEGTRSSQNRQGACSPSFRDLSIFNGGSICSTVHYCSKHNSCSGARNRNEFSPDWSQRRLSLIITNASDSAVALCPAPARCAQDGQDNSQHRFRRDPTTPLSGPCPPTRRPARSRAALCPPTRGG
jgi:hypothetical protein